MSKEKALHAIKDLIEYEKSHMRRDDGYIDHNTRLIRLSYEQAELALRYGIPIGMCSKYDDYHGSHKGEYSYSHLNSMENLKEWRKWQIYDDAPSISPCLPDPKKVLGYLKQIGEIEAASQEQVQEQKQYQKPYTPVTGSNGNIFKLMGTASRALCASGMKEQADQMYQRITESASYREALDIIGEYVDFTDADQPGQVEGEAAEFNMKME